MKRPSSALPWPALGRRLKAEREKLQLTTPAMAHTMRVTPQRWQNYENGLRPIDLEIAMKFCRHFKVSADYLLLGIDPRDLPLFDLDELVTAPTHYMMKTKTGWQRRKFSVAARKAIERR